ncbi:MAG: hypothetical protein K0V04_11105 [Deltaproteobacteria bacterium]|nr:hypothetical protein [Deltaproteobacteria bacterium]
MLIQRFLPLCGAAAAFMAWPDDAQASVRFCFQHDSTYTDSGLERAPACTADGTCEDEWLTDQPHWALGLIVTITKNGSSQVFALEEDGGYPGCTTPFNPSGGDAGWYSINLLSAAVVNNRWIIAGDADDQVASHVFSYFHQGFGNPTITYTGTAGQSFAQFNVLSAATRTASKFATGPGLNFSVAPTTPCSGGGNCYQNGPKKLNIETTNGSHLNKFLIAHEIGHAVMHDTLGAAAISDCNFSTGGANCQAPNHAMRSKEHNSCALVEGFAHYFAAAVWNFDTGTDCWFTYWSPNNTPVSCELGTTNYPLRQLETQCLPSWIGKGTELDWMRALWDYNQNPAPLPRPDFDGVLDLIDAAPTWGTADAWLRMDDGADILGESGRWTTVSKLNGIDH